MREIFRRSLERYGEIAKDEKRIGRSDASEDKKNSEIDRMATVLDWHLAQRAGRAGTEKGVQADIFLLQQEKQAIMEELRQAIAGLDGAAAEKRELPPEARSVVGHDGKLFWRRSDGREQELSFGEIVTDGAWDIDYDLDDSVPRNQRKRLLIERAKRRLADLADRQIAKEEIASRNTDHGRRKAYKAVEERVGDTELPMGFVAERMMVQFLRKLEIDGDLPYSVEEADLFQDVNQKIDFIVRRSDHRRGVRVEEGRGKEVEAAGIQFTLNTNQAVLKHKEDQIRKSRGKLTGEDRLDDILLVAMDMRWVIDAYRRWEKEKPPGGPDKFLAPVLRETIFKKTLSGLADREELDREWREAGSES